MKLENVRELPVAFCRFNANGVVRWANPAAEALLGAVQTSLRGGILDVEDFERLLNTLQHQKRAIVRTTISGARGESIPAELRASAIDRSREYVAAILDLRENSSGDPLLVPLETLANNTPAVAIQIFDAEGRVRLWNPAAERLYGFSREEVLGQRLQDILLHPPEVERFEAEMLRITSTGAALNPLEWTVKHRDGSTRIVNSTMFPISGPPLTLLCCMDVDVTDRRATELALAEREMRLRLLLEQLPAMLWTTDSELRVTSLAGAAPVRADVDPLDALGQRVGSWIEKLGGQAARAEGLHEKALEGEPATFEESWTRRRVRTRIEPFRGRGGEVIGTIGVAFDVSDRQRAEERFRALVEHSYDGVVLLDEEGFVCYAGPSVVNLIGYQDVDVIGRKVADFIHEDDRDRVRQTFAELLEAPNSSVVTQYRVVNSDGATLWMEAVLTNLLQHSAVEAVVVNFRDVSERKESEIQMAHQAYHDALTDLPNRMLFANRLAMALAHARRTDQQLAVLFLDLDNFKVINDTLGHTVGDRLLAEVARRLRSGVRSEDSLARVGGDEFTLFLQACNDPSAAAAVAEKLIVLLDEPFFVEGHRLYVSGSIGISLFPSDGHTAEELLKAADTAMYRAKELGRHGIQIFAPEFNDRYRDRLAMETSMREALERDEFVLHYQPLYDRKTHAMVAVEALIRWNHPTRGLVAPNDFIPLAEDTRMIVAIGEWVLRTACRTVKEWRRALLPSLRLTVNLSGRQFQSGDLLATIDRVLAETGFDPSALEVEITETIAMANADHTLRTLNELKARKISIAIDDFGTGQTSLTYLTRFPIDTVKIDRVFVQNIHLNSNDAAIVSALIALSQRLSMKTVAEGVETEEQLKFLGEQGCDHIQGFLFSRPLPPLDFVSFVGA